jgi:acyl transferase domain-containing protein
VRNQSLPSDALQSADLAAGNAASGAAPIAIVGLACHFPPDCRDPESYWKFLEEGGDAITSLAPGRSDAETGESLPGGYLRGAFPWGFDAAFFGLSPREVTALDPQQRLLLECSWKAIEDAGWCPDKLRGAAIGTYIGISGADYQGMMLWDGHASPDAHTATGVALAPAAGRIAYWFGWEGPAMAVDTACSGSLVAFHLACQALRNGECEAALAGGVNALLRPAPFECLSRMGLLAPDGCSKAFDASANGYVRGEGCGMAVLKKLTAALRDGDRILAVCRGSAVNQNGGGDSLTAPSAAAQEKVIRRALQQAGLSPADIGYVEAHGSGTPAGDAAELSALARVYGAKRGSGNPFRAGSVKTNIGHLEAAAGMAGLIKAVQCLRHERIPPHLHLANPTAGAQAIEVPTRITPWGRSERPRRAGVTSLGFGGTNVHVVLEEAPPTAPQDGCGEHPRVYLLPISARSPEALRQLIRRYQELLRQPAADAAAICYTAAVGRAHFSERVAVVGGTAEQLARLLEIQPAMAVGDPAKHREETTKAGGGWTGKLKHLAELYSRGAEVDWEALYRPWPNRKTSLPAYPFERRTYRPEPGRRRAPAAPAKGQDLGRLARALETGGANMLDVVNEIARSVLSDQPMARLDDDQALVELGITSLAGVELCSSLESAVHVPVPTTVLYNCPSIRQIAMYLDGALSNGPAPAREQARQGETGYEFLDEMEPDRLAALIEQELSRQ